MKLNEIVFVMDLLLDESIPGQIEAALENEGVETSRYNIGASDNKVLGYAIEKDVPVFNP